MSSYVRPTRIVVALVAAFGLLLSITVTSPAGAAGRPAAYYNPWGYQNLQVLTSDQAVEVQLHRINLHRSAHGLAPFVLAADNGGAWCSVNRNASFSRSLTHHDDCIPANAMENVGRSKGYSSGVPSVGATIWARAWHESAGHNRALYATNVSTVQLALRCDVSGNQIMVNSALQVQGIGAGIPTPQYKGGASPEASDPLLAGTTVNCRNGRWVFALHRDLRDDFALSTADSGIDLAPGEPAPSPGQPQLWHRFTVARLYSAYFDRAPDAGGWAYWNRRYLNGLDAWRMSDHFAHSPEFRSRYGNLGDAKFVDLVYRSVMDRAPDAGGRAYWMQRLAGGLSRGELMVYFSESPEYIQRVGPQITSGCWNGQVSASYACAAPATVKPAG